MRIVVRQASVGSYLQRQQNKILDVLLSSLLCIISFCYLSIHLLRSTGIDETVPGGTNDVSRQYYIVIPWHQLPHIRYDCVLF